jgi:hypothetical protein
VQRTNANATSRGLLGSIDWRLMLFACCDGSKSYAQETLQMSYGMRHRDTGPTDQWQLTPLGRKMQQVIDIVEEI